MLLSHAVVLAEARSYLAALAETAAGFDAALEYERVLLHLDWLHDGAVPPVMVVPSGDRRVLKDVAARAISDLAHHGVDRLELAICQQMLRVAWDMDDRS
ncbi:hypothetical protein [Nocardioides terrisoli]|uniref:hypothetical protein n=1 Tax=Nocardioides terrisoli TaxID=3388267 RepID=UPI00287B61C5|nr:hypothetical protein [Nocardioides marmorisolisilvae]